MLIKVNMLRLRVRNDAQPRTKNGQPAHRTTGVASASCTQFEVRGGRMRQPNRSEPSVRTSSGIASTALIHKRRVMSISSGLGPSSRLGCSGSSAMPQIGQAPGASRRIWGCIGQVQIIPGATGVAPGAGAAWP